MSLSVACGYFMVTEGGRVANASLVKFENYFINWPHRYGEKVVLSKIGESFPLWSVTASAAPPPRGPT